MLGVSGLMGSSGDGAHDAAAEAHESGGASGGSSEVGASSSIPGGGAMDESGGGGGGGGGGGNRWPRQETLALLKIRSEMDVTFRDASLKGPLWDEVSRKMAELGFQRSAKKCKEKFENVYKYHKRTKDGRASKSDGKTYRFFDQLEALENTPPNPFTPPPQRRPQPPPTGTVPQVENAANNLPPPPSHHVTVSSTSPTPLSVVFPNTAATTTTTINIPPFQPPLQPPPLAAAAVVTTSMNHPSHIHHQKMTHPHISTSLLSNSTSSSTSSDEDIQMRRGRKRKWKDYFERLMRDIVQKQEELQKKFIDALEKRERDRMAREEAWRAQEMARMNREHDLLVQERSIAAAKDAAVIAFLQKVADQHNVQIPISSSNNNNNNNNNNPTPAPPPPMQVQAQLPQENPQPKRRQQPQPERPPPQQQQPTTVVPPAEQPPPPVLMATPTKIMETTKTDNGGDNFMPATSSRWPKAEVQALINLRTSLDIKYQENGPKGPLWEEISAAMSKLGYNRNAKRCKEKWENINKYYKKVKESSKKRPEDSKTCPYFHQLEAIYKERAKNEAPFNPTMSAPIMAQPEQQWPLPPQQQQQQQQQDSIMHDRDHDNESENMNDHDEDEDDDDDDEDEGGAYEIIANNKQPSSLTNAAE